MKPRKITACIRPGRHSRSTIRRCSSPFVTTLRSRCHGRSQRGSGCSARTIRSLRQLSAAKPPNASSISRLIPTGLKDVASSHGDEMTCDGRFRSTRAGALELRPTLGSRAGSPADLCQGRPSRSCSPRIGPALLILLLALPTAIGLVRRFQRETSGPAVDAPFAQKAPLPVLSAGAPLRRDPREANRSAGQ
jgi:hypothetical protein